jgi:hypothetical protein
MVQVVEEEEAVVDSQALTLQVDGVTAELVALDMWQ